MNIYAHENSFTYIAKETLFKISKSWMDGWMDGWINKMWYIHTTYHLAIKRIMLVHATTCINLETMLSKISQSQMTL